MAIAVGSHGAVEFNATGTVVQSDGYSFITRINVIELERHYGQRVDNMGPLDILTLGYWYDLAEGHTDDRGYEPPVRIPAEGKLEYKGYSSTEYDYFSSYQRGLIK